MSLDFYLEEAPKCPHCLEALSNTPQEVFAANITHNLSRMWDACGAYSALYESQGKRASDITETLAGALFVLRSDPVRFKSFDASNGWGRYEQAVPWLQSVVDACRSNPTATVRVSK